MKNYKKNSWIVVLTAKQIILA